MFKPPLVPITPGGKKIKLSIPVPIQGLPCAPERFRIADASNRRFTGIFRKDQPGTDGLLLMQARAAVPSLRQNRLDDLGELGISRGLGAEMELVWKKEVFAKIALVVE